MKKSKIISLALASVISASSFVSFSSNAWDFGSNEKLIEIFDEYSSNPEKYLDVTDYKCMWNDDDVIAHYAVLNSYSSYRFKNVPDAINFICSYTDIDLIEDIVKGVDDSLQVSLGTQPYEGWVLEAITRVDEDGNDMEIPAEMAREIYGLLKEYVTQRFDYYYDMYYMDECAYGYRTKYPAEYASVLEECVESNNIDAEVVQFDSEEEMEKRIGYADSGYINYVYVVPNEETSLKEKYELAELICEYTGLRIQGFVLESAGGMNGKEIDMYNAVDGDANCDGELTIADATLILQHLGNADKYSLSAQGEFNADITGDYDGISAADALAIQMFETGVIDNFS